MTENYDAFVDKFKPKRTSDDCYTPQAVYDAVAVYVAEHYGVDAQRFVRPFWPQSDFETFDYDDDVIVVDNPPFSIMTKILKYYCERDIKFFLFANTLTLCSGIKCVMGQASIILTNSAITYENGAKVNTSFITNLEPHDTYLRVDPDLHDILEEANAKTETKKERQRFQYPDHVLSASHLGTLAGNGVHFEIPVCEVHHIAQLDAQRKTKNAIFGCGVVVSDDVAERLKTAREQAEANKRAKDAQRQVWELSDRERKIVEALNAKHRDRTRTNTRSRAC